MKKKLINRVVRWRLVNAAVEIVAVVPVITVAGRIVVYAVLGHGTCTRRDHPRPSTSVMMAVLRSCCFVYAAGELDRQSDDLLIIWIIC